MDEVSEGTVIIRSHGVGKAVYENIEKKGLKAVDATCVFVKNIQKKAEEYYNKGYIIVIVGDRNHPEVQGINGWCNGSAVICAEEDDLPPFKSSDKVCVVAQTTIPPEKFDIIVKNITAGNIKTVEVFNTICYTTIERQKEAAELSRQNDAVIVIGGKTSSNTKKLESICRLYNGNVIPVEYAEELDTDKIKKYEKVAIVAGASTPKELIKEVFLRMEQMVNANIIADSAETEEKKVLTEEAAEAVNAAEPALEKAAVEEIKAESAPKAETKVSAMDQAL